MISELRARQFGTLASIFDIVSKIPLDQPTVAIRVENRTQHHLCNKRSMIKPFMKGSVFYSI